MSVRLDLGPDVVPDLYRVAKILHKLKSPGNWVPPCARTYPPENQRWASRQSPDQHACRWELGPVYKIAVHGIKIRLVIRNWARVLKFRPRWRQALP